MQEYKCRNEFRTSFGVHKRGDRSGSIEKRARSGCYGNLVKRKTAAFAVKFAADEKSVICTNRALTRRAICNTRYF